MRSSIWPILAATFLSATSTTAQQPQAEDGLRPGDVIRVTISGEPTNSGDFAVDQTGNVSLPLIGTRSAVGVPAGEIRRQILEAYNSQFRNTAIQVTLLRRISVLGEVRNPGLYHVDTTMTVGDVIAQAGGPNEDGRTNEVRIIRNSLEIRANISPSETLPPELRSGDQLVVPPKSWLAQNGRWLAGIGIGMTALIIRQVY